MSEQERINMAARINAGILKAQRLMFERKSKLGQTVVIADENGDPITVSASEVLKMML